MKLVQLKPFGGQDIGLNLLNNHHITLRKKFITLFVFLLMIHILFTGVSSFFIFQKILESEMSVIDFKTAMLKTQIERYYEEKSDVYKLPELSSQIHKSSDDSIVIKENIEKNFPGMEFAVKTIQGTVQYKEDPKLIYNKDTNDYSFKITREIKFEKNLPFNSLELSIKLNFFKIIIQSLISGSLLAALLIIPFLALYVNKMIKPIIGISVASKKIAAGELGIQVSHKSNDEVGVLSNSFNYMSNELFKMKAIRDDLLATVSHELRSPLGRIRGYTELLLDIQLEESEKKSYYKSILNEVDLLNSMATEIIEVSRLELNNEKLFIEKIDMGFFFDILREDLQILTKTKNVEIIYNFEYGIICEIDVEKFRRVIVNAIQNSINAKSTVIQINTEVTNNNYIINIIDNGIGISEEHFELVFEKFYRLDKSRDRETGGFGLGLAICKGIIREHKGKIYFKKPENSKGSQLVIELCITDKLS